MANEKARDCVYTNNLEIEQSITVIRSWLLTYCTGLTGCKDDGEDVVQEVLFRALPVVSGQSRHPNLKAYLLRIAKHVWIDQVRKRKREVSYVNQNQMAGKANPDSADTVIADFSIESAVKQMIVRLTPLQRTIFLLRDIFGYTTPEVRTCLGMSEAAVKAALHRARSKLKEIQVDAWQEGENIRDDEMQAKILHAYLEVIRNGGIHTLIALGQLQTRHPAEATVQALALADQQVRTRRIAKSPCSSEGFATLLAA